MKKILIAAILASVITVFAFADFTVQSVTGSVMMESGNQRVAVTAGQILRADTVLHTGAGATLVLVDQNGRTHNVAAARNGTITELTRRAVAIGGNVTRTNTDTVSRTTAGNTTASARASDAAGDDDISAE